MLTFPTTWRAAAASGLLTIILVGISCSSSGRESPSPTPELRTPQATLDSARDAMAAVPQFEFGLTHPRGSTSLPGGLSLRSASGAVIAPEHLSVSAEADLGRLFVKVDAVVIEGQTWMTNPLTGNWASIAPEDSPFSFLDPVQLVIDVLESTTEPAYPAGNVLENGLITLQGRVPSEALRGLVGTVEPGQILDVEMEIRSDSFLLESAVMTGNLQPGDDPDYVRHITFDFDGDITIEPPFAIHPE